MVKQENYLTHKDLEDRYNDMLDEVYGEVKVAGYTYTTSHLLKNTDPTAYRVGFMDWLDAELTDGNLETDENGDYFAA